jgi:hypothetical protein
LYVFLVLPPQPQTLTNTTRTGTAQVTPYQFILGDKEITLIDTPGFDDTNRSETEVLKEIADWLETTYRLGDIKLNGIIYIHNIQDHKVTGSGLRNLRMFRNLCGDNPLKNVLLVTSCWEICDPERGEARETELMNDPEFWKPFIAKGSRTARFTDVESGIAMLHQFSDTTPVILKIQQELVDEQKQLVDTLAGQTVNEELNRLEEQHAKTLEILRQEQAEAIAAKDAELQESLEAATRSLERQLARVQREQESLRYERRNEQRRLEHEFDAVKSALQRQIQEQEVKLENERRAAENHRIQIEAQRIEDRLQFDAIIAQLMQNAERLRPEEREEVKVKVHEARKKPHRKGKAAALLINLSSLLGSVAMSVLGFPMLLGDPIGGIMDVFNGGNDDEDDRE